MSWKWFPECICYVQHTVRFELHRAHHRLHIHGLREHCAAFEFMCERVWAGEFPTKYERCLRGTNELKPIKVEATPTYTRMARSRQRTRKIRWARSYKYNNYLSNAGIIIYCIWDICHAAPHHTHTHTHRLAMWTEKWWRKKVGARNGRFAVLHPTNISITLKQYVIRETIK